MTANAHIFAAGICLLFFAGGAVQQDSPIGNSPDDSPAAWLQGFGKEIFGEIIPYHGPQPDASSALLTRATDGRMLIEWETDPAPADMKENRAVFVWIAGISHEDRKRFDLSIDGRTSLSFFSSAEKNWAVEGSRGERLRFRAAMEDGHGDLFGYAELSCPKNLLRPGKPLTIRVTGENAGSRVWFMTFRQKLERRVSFTPEQVLFHQNEKLRQSLQTEIVHLGRPGDVTVMIDGITALQSRIETGYVSMSVPVAAVDCETSVDAEVRINGRTAGKERIVLKSVRPFEIYLLPHSHTDIGYTALQPQIERRHWEFLEQAIKLSRDTAGYPPGSRFKWNVEVLWPIDGYLKQATAEKRRDFDTAVRDGRIGLEALYANELTGLCGPEELFRLTDFGRRLGKDLGIPVETAMISDIPGGAWGLVPALARSGVKYYSSGPNHMPQSPHLGDRIGYFLEDWGDKPFYWISPSGEEKILFWVAGKGYSFFHDWISGALSRNQGAPLIRYLNDLTAAGYPYDIVQLRYTIRGDNGPPDPTLSDFVKKWNETHAAPRLVIATSAEMFREFERRYGGALPSVKGDFTGAWEDGAGSTALETAMARNASDRLVQAETLWSMLDPERFPAKDFEGAWRNVILFDEHTWGAAESVSDPDGEAALGQWKIKQSFAADADRASKELLARALGERPKTSTGAFDVYNTESWSRSDPVVIPKARSLSGDLVKDENGRPLSSQRLTTGELAVWVKDVPAFGAKHLKIEKGEAFSGFPASAGGLSLDNEFLRLTIDPGTGGIGSLIWKSKGLDLVDKSSGWGLNEYLYVPGKNPKNAQRAGDVNVSVKENGPLVASLLIEANAPGCRRLTREVTLISGLDEVWISNAVDKSSVRSKEAVHFAFPFNIPQGVTRIDGPWSVWRPEADQIAGSCKNVLNAGRWVDVSNQNFGVTLAVPDAPLVETGGITAEIWDLDPAKPWLRTLELSSTVLSYVMNNYWHTNYKADQEGLTTFRYAIRPHDMFPSGRAARFGVERSRPLILAAAKNDAPVSGPLFDVESANVIVTSVVPAESGKAWIVRLFNASGDPEETTLRRNGKVVSAAEAGLPGEKDRRLEAPFKIPAWGIRTLIIER